MKAREREQRSVAHVCGLGALGRWLMGENDSPSPYLSTEYYQTNVSRLAIGLTTGTARLLARRDMNQIVRTV